MIFTGINKAQLIFVFFFESINDISISVTFFISHSYLPNLYDKPKPNEKSLPTKLPIVHKRKSPVAFNGL